MAPGGSADYAETFATAKPAGAGQAGSAAPGYADTFATAKQAAPTSVPAAPASFATAKVPGLSNPLFPMS